VHSHVPPTHVGVGAAHAMHAAPVLPQTRFPVPAWQLVPSQQPVLQGTSGAPEQSAPHWLFLHAWNRGQSAEVPQPPHVPFAWHSGAFAVQTTQAPPPRPHAAPTFPG
jgi:hypothetical protein